MPLDGVDQLRSLLRRIDDDLEAIRPPKAVSDETLGEHMARRADNAPALKAVAEAATEGLSQFPLNPALLRRRAEAYLRIVEDTDFPYLGEAENDLRAILAVAPDDISAALQLLNSMFVYSGLEDDEVAKVAGELAEKTESKLSELVALQIEAYGYADLHDKADETFAIWSGRLSDVEGLRSAKTKADSLRSS